jgi:hypothetical protein
MKNSAFATFTIHSTINNGARVLRGIVDIESTKGWLGGATVFGETPEQIQTAAYMEAERRATRHGLTLQSLRPA